MITTYTSRDAEACAYLSALVTVELCAEVHRKGKVNTAIRRCVNRQLPRLVEPLFVKRKITMHLKR